MPEFQRSISGPDLRGLSAPTRPSSGADSAATAQLAGTLVSGALNLYGGYKARQAGEQIGGEGETFESAGVAADAAANELEGLVARKEQEIGAPVTADQAADLRKSVFDKVLNNQKRIQSALSRGLISSTEANARLDVLRNEALSNPLIAPFKDQLDNALYRTTGGAGTFAATAAELEAKALREGELEALQAQQEQVTRLVRSGVANSESQALNIIAQSEQYRLNSEFYADKKARLGLTSQEVYAASQALATQQAASAYGIIAEWAQAGGDAQALQGIQFRLTQEGEAIKQAIRNTAFDEEGNLLVTEDTLRSQLNEVDNRIAGFNQMLKDQSGTQQLMDVMKQRAAALEYNGQKLQIELAKHAPLLFALKDFPAASEWYWNNAVNAQPMATKWQTSSNPILRMISGLNPDALEDKVTKSSERMVNGQPTDETDKAILSTTLVAKGSTAVVDKAMEDNPEQTIKTLTDTPFKLRDIHNSNEWLNKARSAEGKDTVQAIIEGAASRARVSSMFGTTRRETAEEASARGDTRRRWAVPSMQLPDSVTVAPRPQNKNALSSNLPRLLAGPANKMDWMIDTGGVPVSDEYKSELVNAYKLGTAAPQLWQDDFESIDQWLNFLFANPQEAQ